MAKGETPFEKAIRDKLAKRLDVLEPGLQLIATEYSLRNAHGAKGFIDILAKDAWGNRVIIELKRSNQSARQALHEIFKYSALFRSTGGLPYGRIRCFVASTEWHELRVPFAEFIRVADCQCEGFELSVDNEGNVLEATKHEPVELPGPLDLFYLHSAFLFREAAARDEAVDAIVDAFKGAGGRGCFAVALKYEGPNSSVIYGYAVYFVVSSVAKGVAAELEKEAREEVGYSDDEADEIRSSVEDRFLERLVTTAGQISDAFEIGYPEKFTTLLLTDWKVERIARWGQVHSTAAADDDEVTRIIAGTEGQNAVHFHQFTSPKFGIQWNEIRNNAKLCLLGNEVWAKGFNWFCDLIESSSPIANVSFAIYNPLHLPMALFQLVARDDPRFLPSLQIVAVDPHMNTLSGLLGRIEWDGTTRPGSLDNVFTPEFCDLETFFLSEVVKEHWHFDAELMKRHGLYYALERADEDARGFETSPILVEDEAGSLGCRTKTEVGKTINDFIEENQGYLREIVHWIGKHQVGL